MDPMLHEQLTLGVMFSHRQLISPNVFLLYETFCLLSSLSTFTPCTVTAGNFITLLFINSWTKHSMSFLPLINIVRAERTPPNKTFSLLFPQPGRSYRSCPADHSPRTDQSDVVSGWDGTDALPCDWRALSQDFMGERCQDTSWE